jgi:hypothetical protein
MNLWNSHEYVCENNISIYIDIESNLDFPYFGSRPSVSEEDHNGAVENKFNADCRTIQSGLTTHAGIGSVPESKSPGWIQFPRCSWAPDWSNMSGTETIQTIANHIARARIFAASKGCSARRHTQQYPTIESPVMTKASILPVAS